MTVLPPTFPAAMLILYVRSPDPMLSPEDAEDSAEDAMVTSEMALTVRVYRHLNGIESSTRLKCKIK